MSERYKNKYRITSNRLQGWDYAAKGCYFITIVTSNRENLFGEIVEGKMIPNEMGKMVEEVFFKSFEIRKELYLGSFVLMPNHLHALVFLDAVSDNAGVAAETDGRASLNRKPKSISSFVAGFKSAAIKRIDDWIDENHLTIPKFNRHNPLWQSNYYDRIVRNPSEYDEIARYIDLNPHKWDNDPDHGVADVNVADSHVVTDTHVVRVCQKSVLAKIDV